MTGAAKTGTSTNGTQSAGTGTSPSLAGQNTSNDQPLSEKVSDTANGILDKAKETASGTYDAVATQGKDSKIEEHKGELSTGLRTLADTFRKTGTDLKRRTAVNTFDGRHCDVTPGRPLTRSKTSQATSNGKILER